MRISDWSSDVCSSDLVWSAVAVIDGSGRLRSRNVRSVVAFKQLEPAEIEAYLESGEGVGKAGGYAIQGCAAALIRAMSGSYSGVVGLPLFETRALLRTAGYPLDRKSVVEGKVVSDRVDLGGHRIILKKQQSKS